VRGIERRLKRDLFAFLLTDQDYYEDLGRPNPSQPGYRGLVDSLLPGKWSVLRDGMWIRCTPREGSVPDQGFKIHLSTTSRHAQEVLRAVVPICLKAGAPFKVLAADFILDHVNSKNGSRTAAGKFATIYPQDRQSCLELLESLSDATQPFRGPYILSDRPYRDSRAVFYRYGSFRGLLKLNLFGEKESMMRGRDGELIPDTRTPFFRLPAGVADLLPALTAGRGEDIILRGRYAISRSIRFSNTGGIYRAEDLETRREVVLKEARPLVNLSRNNSVDAIETLRKECRVLRQMQHTPFVPRFVDFFEEWEHCFLVEEYLDGVPLSSFRALSEIGLLVRRPFTAGHVRDFCRTFARLAQNLLAAVRTFHDNGILIGDLSPTNVLVDRTSLDVKLIDFEGAFFAERDDRLGETTATAGFISPRRLQGLPPNFADDYYALGSTLYSVVLPVQELFPSNPGAERRFLDAIARDFDLPPEVNEVIFSLFSGEVQRASSALAAMAAEIGSRDVQLRLGAEAGITAAEVERVIAGVKDHLLASADVSREDRLWPADYRVFTTNPLNLGYGALGTALFLREVLGELPENVRDWIAGRPIDNERYPPGLFVGLSGVAWALDELGDSARALQAMDLAGSSPLLHQGTDIFYGKAGVGLASLYFWSRTRQERFLVQARAIAAALEATAATDPDGLYWLNADDGHYYGFAHGGAGIAFFLLKLHQATGDFQYLEQGKAALEYEIRRAVEEPDGSITWPRSVADSWISPYWRFGASGVGSVLIRYAVAVGEERYRTLAERAAHYAAVRFTVFPGQFVGLSGVGEFLLDMYHFTRDSNYLRDAWRLAEGVLMFQVQRPQGILFPGDELVRFTTDYGTGSAGIGLFLLRLLRPGARRFYDFAAAG
jgi:serine/threonine protein kinase